MPPFRLLHYSDPHFGAYDPRISRAAIDAATKLRPDLTLVSGDFCMRGRKYEFELAHEWLAMLPEPHLAFPGNHDVPGLNHLADRFFTPFRRFRKYISETEEPSAQLGEVGILATANSSTPFGLHLDWSKGFLSPLQTHAASTFFRDSPVERLRVFGMHHPVIGSGEKSRALVSPMPLVKRFLADARIDLLLVGHFHQSKISLFPVGDENARQLVVSQAPSICSTRLKGEPNGFHLITLSRDSISIELWRWHCDAFQQEREHSFSRSENGWDMD